MNKKYLLILFVIITVTATGAFFIFLRKHDTENKNKFYSAENIKTSEGTVITITKTGFSPSEVTVKKGQKVVWVNKASDFAWPASDPHPTHTIYSGFDPEEPLATDQAWEFTFDKAGKWQFHDHLKPSNRGIINVPE